MCMDKRIIYGSEDINAYTSILSNRIKSIADMSNPLYVCVLKGAVPFFAKLTSYLPSGMCEYITCSSYNYEGEKGDLHYEIPHAVIPTYPSSIFIIDDICDTGSTLKTMVDIFKKRFPHSDVYGVCLINRLREDKVEGIEPLSAIETKEDTFFAGFGMDNKGYDRNLSYIYDCSDISLQTD